MSWQLTFLLFAVMIPWLVSSLRHTFGWAVQAHSE